LRLRRSVSARAVSLNFEGGSAGNVMVGAVGAGAIVVSASGESSFVVKD